MKIMIAANEDHTIYNMRRELVERLLQENEVYLILKYGVKLDKLIAQGCKFIEVCADSRGTNPRKDLQLLKIYEKILSEVKPDIVLTFTTKVNIYMGMACSKKKIPYITNVTGLGTALENPGLLQPVMIKMYKKAVKKSSCVFFQNEANKEFFIKHNMLKGKYDLLPGSGVNLEQYHYCKYPKDDVIVFLYAARIMKQKGIDLYLQVAEKILQKYDNVKFGVVGACNEEYIGVIKEYENRGIIQYYGVVDTISELLEKCNCLIHPSYYPEGISNVCLESSAVGRAVITTNRSGCRETVEHGVTGYICEMNNLDSLYEMVERFINLTQCQKESMGIAARKRVEKMFDRNIVISKYIEQIEMMESM